MIIRERILLDSRGLRCLHMPPEEQGKLVVRACNVAILFSSLETQRNGTSVQTSEPNLPRRTFCILLYLHCSLIEEPSPEAMVKNARIYPGKKILSHSCFPDTLDVLRHDNLQSTRGSPVISSFPLEPRSRRGQSLRLLVLHNCAHFCG